MSRARSTSPAPPSTFPGLPLLLALGVAVAGCAEGGGSAANGTEWKNIAGNDMGQRYSSLDQIDAENFESLEVAWIWDGSDYPAVNARATPIYVDGMLISVAGEKRHTYAIDAGTGEKIWEYVEPETFRWEYSMRKNHGKGVAYGEIDGRAVVYMVSPAFFLHALWADTGEHVEGFGGPVDVPGFPESGVVDLLAGLGHEFDPYYGIPLETGYITSSSPPIVVNGVVVIGNSAEQGYNQSRRENVPGDILGYDARTGDFMWKFNVLPGPGEFGHETWENDAWEWTGDISSWAPLSADQERGIVYIPTNGATMDFWGGFRPGDNLFSTSLIALDVQTGERVWHFQLVHHDIWNYDTPQIPVLMDVTVDGEDVPAVVQVTKQAFAYAFNRETGDPIWPIEERPVPEGLMPGEALSPTQPFPTWPAPYDMQGLTHDDLIDFTPELREAAIEALDDYVIGPLFTPPLHRDNDLGKMASMWCPGDVGGTNIDGTPAADPETSILYVTSQKGCGSRIMVPGEERDAREPAQTGTTITKFAVGGFAGVRRVQGLPLFKPPYSRITAIDMNTGEHLWWIPVGDTPNSVLEHDALQGMDIPNTGTGRQAAQIVTSTLLMYTGEGSDGTSYLFAVDKATGERLGRVELPAQPRYGMMTYMHEGRQHVVVQAPNTLMALRLAD
ncbi:MAG: PQQ-binding-like beta-propeller repeat protein [Gemmatimonadales bacterium]|nr:PQQ-binding-like beta-propeller repeat protein [Gemmatimonadales bacterium]MXX78476.1 PQQ-binding-like beta-propeller repeat protein [Gemmatimonadales bacterium]MYC87499.1 PQQ-binding-like beta-propeller repeat protein [Candidatus Palauibacter denitrificans]